MARSSSNFFAFISRNLVALATYSPLATLFVAGTAAVVAVVLGMNWIELHTSRADLLNPKNEYHKRWLAYVNEFSDQEDVYVVVEGSDRRRIREVIRELAAALRQEPNYFHSILERVDKTPLARKGLYYLPKSQLVELYEQLLEARSRLEQNAPLLNPAGFLVQCASDVGQFPAHSGPSIDTKAWQGLLPVLQAQLAGQSEVIASQVMKEFAAGATSGTSSLPLPMAEGTSFGNSGSQEDMFFSGDGRLALLMLRFTPDTGQEFTRFAPHIHRLRHIVGDVSQRYPDVSIGVTGLPVLEYDEMQTSNSSVLAAIVSLAGVVLVFFAGFGSIRHTAGITLSLSMGVIWSVGFVAIAMGHLNILTSAFGAMLIGLGDYGVHFVAHYLERRRGAPDVRSALIATAEEVGPSIATGAWSTAAAFFAGALTDFLGVAELGIIAGGGILLCWLSDITVLPAFLCLVDKKMPEENYHKLIELTPWFRPLAFFPKTATLIVVAIVAVFAIGLPRLRYDYNLLHLQAFGLDSVQTQNKLVEHMSRSSYFALSIAPTVDEARQRKARFLALPSVDHVEDLVSVFPEDVAERRPLIEQMADNLGAILASSPAIPPKETLEQALARLEMSLGQGPEGLPLISSVQHLRAMLAAMPEAEYRRRLSELPAVAHAQLETAFTPLIFLLRDSSAPNLNDLPPALVERFVGKGGHHLLQVYCKGDFWDPETMRQFVSDVRSVDPGATGNPIQIYEACHQMNRAYLEAAGYALIAILLTLYLDFRNIRDILLSLVPLALGLLCLFGLMGWFDLPLNPANMITLPLILGIGIDNGVHITHDYRRQRGHYFMPEGATLAAVTVNSLTTLVGFGALMLSPHRGLQSLGRVLTFGMAFCLLLSLLMPGLLRWLQELRGRARNDEHQEWEKSLQELIGELPESQSLVKGDRRHGLVIPRRVEQPTELAHDATSAAEIRTDTAQTDKLKPRWAA